MSGELDTHNIEPGMHDVLQQQPSQQIPDPRRVPSIQVKIENRKNPTQPEFNASIPCDTKLYNFGNPVTPTGLGTILGGQQQFAKTIMATHIGISNPNYVLTLGNGAASFKPMEVSGLKAPVQLDPNMNAIDISSWTVVANFASPKV